MGGFERGEDAFGVTERLRPAQCGGVGGRPPMALLPPPTQARTQSGSRPSASVICCLVSAPITVWKSRTIRGHGAGSAAV